MARPLIEGNCSRNILIITVIGIESTIPGIHQIYPHNINMIKMVITLIESYFPIKMGSKILPTKT